MTLETPGTASSRFVSGRSGLEVSNVAGLSAATTAWACSPLKLLVPRPRGESVWAYLSSFGGGMVAGDETAFDIELQPNTRCFISTQASTKIYRNPARRPCSHRVRAEVGENSVLVLAPDPVQSFADSVFNQRQEILLHPTAGLVLLDWYCSGRVARGERWAFTQYASRVEIWNTDSRRLFLDSVLLNSACGPLDAPMRLGRFNCLAMLLLLGPPLQASAQMLLRELGEHSVERRHPLITSASPVQEHGAMLRVAGESVEQVAHELHHHLKSLAALLGDDPFARKW